MDVNGRSTRLHLVIVGIKGDWPFLRTSCHLRTGFTSTRKCHMCRSEAAYPRLVCLIGPGVCTKPILGFLIGFKHIAPRIGMMFREMVASAI